MNWCEMGAQMWVHAILLVIGSPSRAAKALLDFCVCLYPQLPASWKVYDMLRLEKVGISIISVLASQTLGRVLGQD